MNILILGTSNSILKNGYVSGIKRALPKATWTNWSSGASPGVQFAKYAQKDFSQYDVVLLDSVPNDEQFGLQTSGYQYHEDYRRVLFELVSTISAQTRLIVIGISVRSFFSNASDVYQDRERFACVNHAQFIDVTAALRTYAFQEKDVYSDHPAHPKSHLSQQIGFYLGQAISAKIDQLAPSGTATDYSQNFHSEKAHLQGNSDKIKHYKNSLTQATYLSLESGEKFNVPNSHRLIGFHINGCQTNAAAKLQTSKDKYLQARLYYVRKKDGFLNLFMPMAAYQAVQSICVESTVKGSFDFEPRMTRPNRDDSPAAIQLGELLYWTQAIDSGAELNRDVTGSAHLQLNEIVQRAVVDEVRKNLASSYKTMSGITKLKQFIRLKRFTRRYPSTLTS